MTTETQKPQRKSAAKSNNQGGCSPTARRGGVNYNFTLTERQQAISRNRLDYPGDITLGQRWEAIRRLLIKELTAASAYLEAGPEADAWLEGAVGDALVRGYALGLVHAVQGAGAEKSTPMTHEDGKPVMDVLEQQADHRPSDSAVAALHQQLRQALPLENGASLIGRLRNDRGRLSAQERANREASPDERN